MTCLSSCTTLSHDPMCPRHGNIITGMARIKELETSVARLHRLLDDEHEWALTAEERVATIHVLDKYLSDPDCFDDLTEELGVAFAQDAVAARHKISHEIMCKRCSGITLLNFTREDGWHNACPDCQPVEPEEPPRVFPPITGHSYRAYHNHPVFTADQYGCADCGSPRARHTR